MGLIAGLAVLEKQMYLLLPELGSQTFQSNSLVAVLTALSQLTVYDGDDDDGDDNETPALKYQMCSFRSLQTQDGSYEGRTESHEQQFFVK